MTAKELNEKMLQILKSIDTKDKKEFKSLLKQIKKKADKLDSFVKNLFEDIDMFFTFNLDNQILKIIDDLADNIEDPRLDPSIKKEIEDIIIKFLSNDSNTKDDENNNKGTQQGKDLWEEKKKVRKAL